MESFFDGKVVAHPGDCLEVLKTLPDASVDSVVTDPPYHLTAKNESPKRASPDAKQRAQVGGFMNMKWDGGNIGFRVELWAEVLRVLKPGGHLLAFGGTRTYHRMACAIEDAGFDPRDMIAWTYGSGFPKSHNISKAIDKAAGAKRTIVPKGKPVRRMIPGADQNKVGWDKTNGREYQPGESLPATAEALQWDGWGTAMKPALEPICMARKPLSEGTVAANVMKWGTGALNIEASKVGSEAIKTEGNPNMRGGHYGESAGGTGPREGNEHNGRWPANLIHDGSGEVVAAFPAEAGAFAPVRGTEPSNLHSNVYGARTRLGGTFHDDSGSAARFFYSAKADVDDRLGSKHPTIKPVDLMRYLVRLVTPPGGVVLDPFAGTGTTGEAAWREGFRCILIEREAEYQNDIRRRMALCVAGHRERRHQSMKASGKAKSAGPLFGEEP